nr:hypothetical protein [Enterococcus casseliflavus]
MKKCQSVGHLFHSCSLFRPSIMLLSDWLVRLYTNASQKKKGRKKFCKKRKTFSYGIPFFSAYRRCKFKARQTAISYARMSEINNEERRSKNKCPMTFLKIKAFSPPTNRNTQMDF